MVLLALPRMDPLPGTLEEIDELVECYLAGLRAARDAGDRSFLMALADYGRRYEVIVDTHLPLDAPATLSLVEDREGERWIDVVWWCSLAEARAAAERAMSSESCVPMFALIDMESTLMLHGERVHAA